MKSGKHKSFSEKLLRFMGITLGILIYTSCFVCFTLFYFGGVYMRAFLCGVLIYQYIFCKKSETFRSLLKWLRPYDYFDSCEMIVEEELDESNSLFSFHPHGVCTMGFAFSNLMNETINKAASCASRMLVRMPFSGILATWLGVKGVNQKNFVKMMQRGQNISFLPGGFEEATLTKNSHDRVYIKQRKGFIKYALEHGYKVHPCYIFNENNIFNTVNFFESFRVWFNKFKIPTCLFFAKYVFWPRTDVDLLLVIGKGIQFPKISNPTSENVDYFHQIYIDSLVGVFNRHKSKLGITRDLEVN